MVYLALFSFLLAKVLSPTELGILGNAEAIITIIAIFSLQGLDQLIQKELIDAPNRRREIIIASFIIKIASVIISMVIYSYILYNADEEKQKILLIFAPIILFRSLSFLSSLLIVDNKARIFFLIGAFSYSISFLIKIYILIVYRDIILTSYTIVIEAIIPCILYFTYNISTNKHNHSNRKKIIFYIKKIWRDGFYLVLSSAVLITYSKIDQLIIAHYIDYKYLGEYILSSKFLMIYIIPSSVLTMSFAAKLVKKNNDYYCVAKKMLKETLYYSLVLTILCAVTSPFIIMYIYGDTYQQSIYYIIAQSLLIPLNFILNTSGRLLINENMSKFILQRNILALIINIILSLVLIPIYGVWGGIITTIICYSLSSFIFILTNKKSRSILRKIINEN